MTCSRVCRLLSAYHDAELPTESRGAVRRHLRKCADCRRILEGLQSMAALSEKWAKIEPPVSLWDALAPKIASACNAVARAIAKEAASATDEHQRQAHPKRTFKPVVEGLEDRYPLSGFFGPSALATLSCPVIFAAATVSVLP